METGNRKNKKELKRIEKQNTPWISPNCYSFLAAEALPLLLFLCYRRYSEALPFVSSFVVY
jgi:hypothetical protein